MIVGDQQTTKLTLHLELRHSMTKSNAQVTRHEFASLVLPYNTVRLSSSHFLHFYIIYQHDVSEVETQV
jgi:hypothetical protein